MASFGIPLRLPPLSRHEEGAAASAAASPAAPSGEDDSAGSYSSGGWRGAETTSPRGRSPALSTSSSGATGASGGVSASPKVTSTRTRTVKSRALFTPENEMEKKPRGRGRRKGSGVTGRGRGRPRKLDAQGQIRRSGLQDLLEDEEAPLTDDAARDAYRKRSRNASDGENRWDRIRAKFKLMLHKMRRDTHFLQVYQQDGWRSSGREKLKPVAELKKAEDRIRGVKAELRQVAQRLTEMNSGGFRWGAIQEDGEGNIEVDEILCTKCNLGDSDEQNDILLCDFEGCFRAYHQNCLSPPIKPGAFPEGEQDWFCWQCECLMDCLEMLEDEFQGKEFTSWKEVFPDAEEGGEGGAAGQEYVLPTDSDEDDDESFNGSSSESEDNTTTGRKGARRTKGSDGESSGGDDSGGSSNDEDGSDSESDEDSEAGWMSDAESVGADEVSKLYSEAGDLAFVDEIYGGGEATGEQPLAAEGDRGTRARARRGKRNAALDLGGDHATPTQHEKREMAAALAGNRMDTANIVESRTRRKQTVDYVKLNEAVFGDESVDGDQLSADEQADESSEASGGEASDASASPPSKKATPKRKSKATIDPATGLPRTRGRPRKIQPPTMAKDATGSSGVDSTEEQWRVSGTPTPKPELERPSLSGRPRTTAKPKPGKMPSIDPATGEKRKRGRPRGVSVVDSRSTGGAGGAGGAIFKRKRGRPRKSESDLLKRKAGAGSGVDPLTPGRASGGAPSHRSPPSAAGNGAFTGYETNRGKGRARDVEDVIVVGDDSDEGRVARGMPAIDYEHMEDDTTEVAAMAAAVAAKAEERSAAGPAATPVKRGRGRPPKTSTPSSASVGSGSGLSARNGFTALTAGSGEESATSYNNLSALAVTQPAPGVMQVKINRPDKMNAMNSSFFVELRGCFDRLAIDKGCRAIVLCGSGKIFSSGLDLEEHAPAFADMTSTSPDDVSRDPARKSVEIARFVSGMQDSMASLERCPKPVICAVHSACVGGGVDLVCATDIRVASSDAWFSIKEVDLGLCADLGTLQRLPNLIGSDSLARELVFTARKFPAAEALKAGFLSAVVDDKEELMNHAIKLGSQIAARSPVAMQGSKVNLNYARDHTVAQALEYQALWSSVMLQTGDIPTAMASAQKGKPPRAFPPL